MKSEFRIQIGENCSPFAEQGFDILPDVLLARECEVLARELSEIYEREHRTIRRKIGGIRNLLRRSSLVSEVASSGKLTKVLSDRIGEPAFPVRALFFDKTVDANWHVPWHQDLTIAVKDKIETAGFHAWSLKDDILHVQPPRGILESMATLRIHLDDCNSMNGPLRIIPSSHLQGKLSASEISEQIKRKSFICEIPKGSALLMRPLLLHSSTSAKTPFHRRVLHIEYTTRNLPDGLRWFDSR